MIHLPIIDIPNWVKQYLPHWKRTRLRLQILSALLSPFVEIVTQLYAIRLDKKIATQVTLETKSLEWYLILLYDPGGRSITIYNPDLDGVLFGIASSEPAYYQALALSTEAPPHNNNILVGLPTENVNFAANYLVNIPETVFVRYKNEIIQTLNQYKPANKSWLIQTF